MLTMRNVFATRDDPQMASIYDVTLRGETMMRNAFSVRGEAAVRQMVATNK